MDLLLDDCPEETVSPTQQLGTDADRDRFVREWLSGVGGSDAGTIAGLNPYKTPQELYAEKRGEIPLADLTDNAAVQWGIRLEDVIADRYAEVTGCKVRRNNRCLRHPQYPFMIAHLDREVVGGRILECKTTRFGGDQWGEEGTDQVPEHYLLQCQHYLAVTGREVADLAVLIGGQDFRIYTISRDDDLIRDLVVLETEFWEAVQDGIPPAVNPVHPRAMEAIKRLYPGTDGQTVYLSDEIATAHEILHDAKSRIKEAQKTEAEMKARILAAMGSAAVGLLPNGAAYTRKLVARAGYTAAPTTYIDFRYSAKGAK
jgi:putative phage-type endonuclease